MRYFRSFQHMDDDFLIPAQMKPPLMNLYVHPLYVPGLQTAGQNHTHLRRGSGDSGWNLRSQMTLPSTLMCPPGLIFRTLVKITADEEAVSHLLRGRCSPTQEERIILAPFHKYLSVMASKVWQSRTSMSQWSRERTH